MSLPVAGFLSNGVVMPILVGAAWICARYAFAAATPAASEVGATVVDPDDVLVADPDEVLLDGLLELLEPLEPLEHAAAARATADMPITITGMRLCMIPIPSCARFDLSAHDMM